MGKQFEIEATMESGEKFTFSVSQKNVVLNSHVQEYLEFRVAQKRAQRRHLKGRVIKVINRTMTMVQSQSKLHTPWYG